MNRSSKVRAFCFDSSSSLRSPRAALRSRCTMAVAFVPTVCSCVDAARLANLSSDANWERSATSCSRSLAHWSESFASATRPRRDAPLSTCCAKLRERRTSSITCAKSTRSSTRSSAPRLAKVTEWGGASEMRSSATVEEGGGKR